MDFGALFSRAARITWDHKVLWLFGFIVSLFGGGYSASMTFRGLPGFNPATGELPIDPATGAPDFSQMFPFLPRTFDPSQLSSGDIQGFWAGISGIIAVALCVGLIVSLVLALIQWFGRGALIGMVNDVEGGAQAVSASRGVEAGSRSFLRLFVIALLLGLPSAFLAIVGVLTFGAGIATFISEAVSQSPENLNPAGLLGGLGCLLPLVCLAVILGWFLGLLRNLAVRAAVIEGMGVVDSLRRGWRLLIGNIGAVLVIWIILAILGVLFSFLAGLPGIAIGLPALFGVSSGEFTRSLFSLTLLLSCVYGLLIAALSSLLVTYVSATWTLAYRSFAGQAAAPALPPNADPGVAS